MGDGIMNFSDFTQELFEDCKNEYDNYSSFMQRLIYDDLDDIARSKIKILDQHGGGEGGGEHVHVVFSYKDETYKIDASYYSYHGVEFDGATVYKVTPVEKTITVWESKK